jgi:hypothetical protein
MSSNWTRRDFVRAGAVGAAAAMTPGALAAAARGAPVQATDIPAWAFDVDGNGVIDARDRAIIEASLQTQRGFGIEPLPGYDYRADLRGRGRVTGADLDAFDRTAVFGPAPTRPEVICFHYGWYQGARRVDESTTATFLGGDYDSHNTPTEDRFNALKNEFGITADLLSWIHPPAQNDDSLNNYDRGYFAASSAKTRKFGWLYETAINLGSNAPMSMAPDTGLPYLLAEHFRRMADRFIDPAIGNGSANVLRLDGRPVIFIYASHLLGTTLLSMIDVARALTWARQAFTEIAGVPPYLIGDELPITTEQGVSSARRLRASFFDAVSRYHHYEDDLVAAFAADGPVSLGGDYLQRILDNERRSIEAFAGLRNRFTGAPVLVLPSSAAGFAKRGFPTLHASRSAYERLLRATRQLSMEHLTRLRAEPQGQPLVQAPALVGSWNEEFEGHAVFPAARNEALVRGGYNGFEWLTAIKHVYGSYPA